MPLASVGLIVIDECHEPSYKQEQSPRYSALRLASTLSRFHKGKLVLGSATPNVSDYYVAAASERPIIRLESKAKSDSVKPTVQVIDMTKKANFSAHRFFSDALIARFEKTLAAGQQALVFHNRRGSAASTLCENCGWQAGCPRCFIPLTLHSDQHKLICHICAASSRVPTQCPSCGGVDIIHKGMGTKLIESELRKLFPKATIARFDADTDATQTVERRYQELYDGSIDIIIGTQVIAKGLDLPHLRTVGVVQADAGLSLPDYTAAERTFQLLYQVIGRVGRSSHETHVVVQSYQPTNPAVQDGISQDYAAFYERALALRKAGNFPPFTYLLKLTCTYKTEATAIKNAKALAGELARSGLPVELLGPTPSFYERVRDTYRWQIVVKSSSRQALIDALQYMPTRQWQYELDPLSLL
jgi:primosomal protein N' (replication factor Y)